MRNGCRVKIAIDKPVTSKPANYKGRTVRKDSVSARSNYEPSWTDGPGEDGAEVDRIARLLNEIVDRVLNAERLRQLAADARQGSVGILIG